MIDDRDDTERDGTREFQFPDFGGRCGADSGNAVEEEMNRVELRYHMGRIADEFEKAHMETEAKVIREVMEQPEIIRCKDCRKGEYDFIFNMRWCDGKRVEDDHYCGYAERRTDE